MTAQVIPSLWIYSTQVRFPLACNFVRIVRLEVAEYLIKPFGNEFRLHIIHQQRLYRRNSESTSEVFWLRIIKFCTCKNVSKSLLDMANLLFTSWHVRIKPSWTKCLTTFIPLRLQWMRPAQRPGGISGLAWRGVKREKQLAYPSSFLTWCHIFSIFFKTRLSFIRTEAFPGEIYKRFQREILSREADSHQSKVELGSSLNHSRRTLNWAANW